MKPTRALTLAALSLTAVAVLCLAALPSKAEAKTYTLTSPDGRLRAEVSDGQREGITYSVYCDGQQLMHDNVAALIIEGEGTPTRISSAKEGKLTQSVDAPFYRQAHVDAQCNTLTLTLTQGLSLEFRAYDQGLAYRFTSHRKGDFRIEDEKAVFSFTQDFTAYLPYTTNEERPLAMAFQATYGVAPLSQSKPLPAFMPATVDCGQCKLTLMEADLEAYPGMFLTAKGTSLEGLFAHYPRTTDYWPWRHQLYVTDTEPYIATSPSRRAFPWRVMAISHDDREMPLNDLVYLLASPNRIGDTSWVRPGKVAWDWWNDWGLEGVPFKAGINTETYKYYIDFASRHGLEYVILDEGWYTPKSGDMLTVVPDIDLPALTAYAQERGVGLILWTVFNVLDDQLEEACSTYAALGIRGFKVDFLDRDDQTAVEMAYRIAEACARHHLMLDYHGIYKPTGINRTFPNIVNFESVFGMEEAKWTPHEGQDMPAYDVTFPFIRMQTGFVDFTPGGMRNATRADFQPVYSNPMTMGTRCHQAAMYIVHDSPLTMLADSPTAYEKDSLFTAFISSLPTVFDETLVPLGRLGEYIVTARRHGGDWYVGGQTSWEERELTLPLGFLTEGVYEATLLTDGANASKVATDYRLEQRELTPSDSLTLSLAPGGGFAMRLTRK